MNEHRREQRSVRLRDDEWSLAEAISRLNGERGAGFGLRMALKQARGQLVRQHGSETVDSMVEQITAERSAAAGGK